MSSGTVAMVTEYDRNGNPTPFPNMKRARSDHGCTSYFSSGLLVERVRLKYKKIS